MTLFPSNFRATCIKLYLSTNDITDIQSLTSSLGTRLKTNAFKYNSPTLKLIFMNIYGVLAWHLFQMTELFILEAVVST